MFINTLYKLNFRVILLFFFIFFASTDYSQEATFEKSILKYAIGDSSDWKSPEYKDNNWRIVFNNFIPYESNKLWVRANFYSDISNYDKSKYQIFITITATYELYWNGEYIGNNCISGNDISKRNGQYSRIFNLPHSNTFKNNTLALRLSIGKNKGINITDLFIDTQKIAFESNLYLYGFLFALFVLHLIFLFLFIHNQLKFTKAQVVYFNILLISILFALIYEAMIFLGILTYYHDSILNIVEFYQNNFLLFGISLFYFEEFKVKGSKLFLIAIAIALLIVNYLNLSDAYLNFVGLFPPIFLLTLATIRKKVAALYSLIFLFIIFSISFAWFVVQLNDISFLIFPSFFIIRKIKLDAEKTRKLHEAELRAKALETEMLKKILQPHYIMNSLNTVLEFIEESPKKSIMFIRELSDEFRSFLIYSNKKFITIKDEIALCRRHLKIMEYRQLKKYYLKTNISNMNNKIPPAILHTLIENGVTHNSIHSDSVCFFIDEQTIQNGTKYRISVNYKGNCSELSKDEDNELRKKSINSLVIIEGSGTKYIRSRLTESYGENWDLTFYGNETIWITEIEIYNGKIK